MIRGLERAWVRVLDSTTWRKTAGGSAMRALRASDMFAAADLKRRFALSRIHALRQAERYSETRTLCLLIGHTKSGGSLMGALLDAHPHAAFGDETDALAYLSAGFAPAQVYYLLEKAARREAMKGRITARRLEPYSLAVPGQWQGKALSLKVVGDSKAGIATQRLGADPDLIPRLERMLDPAELRLLHVVRNPFDPMGAMMIRGKRTFDSAIDRYFANCAILDDLRNRLGESMIKLVRYEDVVADPSGQLAAVSEFLGLDVDDAYLRACASIVEPRAPERDRLEWEQHQIDRVEREIARYRFLHGYSFAQRGTAA